MRCEIDFNPRARVGRDRRLAVLTFKLDISIHAPAWGATELTATEAAAERHFNPRARVGRDGGATCLLSSSRTSITYFNPRARVGRDRRTFCIFARFLRFQSTRPRGARRGGKKTNSHILAFQSTRPRGARPLRRWSRAARTYFNPRARVGRDLAPPFGRWTAKDISIHAPAWGATAELELLSRG